MEVKKRQSENSDFCDTAPVAVDRELNRRCQKLAVVITGENRRAVVAVYVLKRRPLKRRREENGVEAYVGRDRLGHEQERQKRRRVYAEAYELGLAFEEFREHCREREAQKVQQRRDKSQ